jgi:hypothetical protein
MPPLGKAAVMTAASRAWQMVRPQSARSVARSWNLIVALALGLLQACSWAAGHDLAETSRSIFDQQTIRFEQCLHV